MYESCLDVQTSFLQNIKLWFLLMDAFGINMIAEDSSGHHQTKTIGSKR